MENGKFTTTFASDFTIADRFGCKAVLDTFKRAFSEWKGDYRYLTDLVLVLNHKIWEHWEAKSLALAHTYDDIWRTADAYAYNNLKGEELEYFVRLTD